MVSILYVILGCCRDRCFLVLGQSGAMFGFDNFDRFTEIGVQQSPSPFPAVALDQATQSEDSMTTDVLYWLRAYERSGP
jgi:hypothetical protein